MSEEDYKQKYLKYKFKYLNLKEQHSGGFNMPKIPGLNKGPTATPQSTSTATTTTTIPAGPKPVILVNPTLDLTKGEIYTTQQNYNKILEFGEKEHVLIMDKFLELLDDNAYFVPNGVVNDKSNTKLIKIKKGDSNYSPLPIKKCIRDIKQHKDIIDIGIRNTFNRDIRKLCGFSIAFTIETTVVDDIIYIVDLPISGNSKIDKKMDATYNRGFLLN